MGTSSSFGGPGGGTPLVPSWLEGDPTTIDLLPGPTSPVPAVPATALPAPGPSDRFSAARGNYSRFAGSGGQDGGSLRRSLSSYVASGAGGARRAAQRMGSSRAGGAALANFLADVAARGGGPALRALNLGTLVGRPIEDVFIGLAEYVCPEGGSVDAGIAREAFIETIADLSANGITDLNTMTADQMRVVFELYATHSIEARLCNDIGMKLIILPTDAQEAGTIQAQIHDYIRRAVADALDAGQASIEALTQDRVLDFVTDVYERAFEILESASDEEDAP